jgi:hypothetical protein
VFAPTMRSVALLTTVSRLASPSPLTRNHPRHPNSTETILLRFTADDAELEIAA